MSYKLRNLKDFLEEQDGEIQDFIRRKSTAIKKRRKTCKAVRECKRLKRRVDLRGMYQ